VIVYIGQTYLLAKRIKVSRSPQVTNGNNEVLKIISEKRSSPISAFYCFSAFLLVCRFCSKTELILRGVLSFEFVNTFRKFLKFPKCYYRLGYQYITVLFDKMTDRRHYPKLLKTKVKGKVVLFRNTMPNRVSFTLFLD
jgi:hypothetical protein